MTSQAPHSVLMVRPSFFGSNKETIQSNAFQHRQDIPVDQVQGLALKEFNRMVDVLNANHITTLIIQDTDLPRKPDAIFPNNWVSMQPDGKLVLYPLLAANRRLERRDDIPELIKSKYKVTETLDFTSFENSGGIVEGTGSLIFDHVHKIAYAARSPRTSEGLVLEICNQLGYAPIVFTAKDEAGIAIYHTNVMLAVATEFAMICLDSVQDENDQDLILNSFEQTGHKVIAISFDQMKSFAGNVMEVLNTNNERVLIISEAAVQALLPGQLDAITKFMDIVPIAIPTIEKYGGGSVRCMLAGIHLPPKA